MKILLCVLSLFVMLSCAQNGERREIADIESPAIEPVAMKTSPLPDRPVPERKLIRSGSMSFEVESVKSARAKIERFTRAVDGYVSSETQNGSDDHPNYNQVIRIPGASVDDFVMNIEGIAAKIDSKHISVQDVTAEFVDIQSRLSAKQNLEERYLEIVKQAKTVEDILKVEDQIGAVRSDIESMQGRLKFLGNQTSYGTIELTYYEHYRIETPGVGGKFASSFIAGWNALVSCLIGLTSTWPFLIIVAGCVWLYRRYNKRIREITPQQ